MPEDRIPKLACHEMDSIWKKEKRQAKNTSWRKTVMKELEEVGLTWGEAQAKARDRSVWRSFVAALSQTGRRG